MKMKKFFKSRTGIGIASIVFALIISFGITPLLNNAMKKQTEIVRASKDIRKGEEITKDKIVKVKVGAYNLPQSIVRDSNEVIGSYAKVDIQKDDYFLNTKISKIKEEDSYLVDKENMAISVTIRSLAAGLSGKLKSGDIVSIISSGDNDFVPRIIPELQYVEVLSVSTKEGVDAESGKEDKLPSTVTLRVNSIQGEKIVEHEQNGNIHFLLVYRGSKEKAEEYLKIQEEYIESLEMGDLEIEGEEGENEEEVFHTEIEDKEEKHGEEGREEVQEEKQQ